MEKSLPFQEYKKIASHILFHFLQIFLPFHEAFVEIWRAEFDFLFDDFTNNGLPFTTFPDQFQTIYIFV